ncbi:FadR family transcriptional regulator [Polaribacter sp. R2A056_3_33]|jgi:GntR family transcriptional repressor for pyruvate dehydrogenase complex|uniref:FadR/GntR family transcriptional regulator n=1 Tax=unclassified Polaribacter TaxID=196858 RepID=UPI001C4E59CE|nr:MULTISPECIES: FCD domain-containing protein [unclassified Polaribacter]QXP63147.1 FadR family transcriptional regulator [Polaribacter sp. HaHaR_3_91]QXP71179.1 FadR family transcriptional regulator [Polaribacter sp. R2A056_3_33]
MKISLIDTNAKKTSENSVICMIRDLINSKNLERGDKLPSERIMSEKFDIKRNHIREAIRKLEFYGIIKSMSQSGTILNIGLTGFNGMVDEIISLNTPTFNELVETRISLELKTVSLAAQRRTETDLKRIKDTLNDFKAKITEGDDYLEEDLLFHLAIAKASKNNTMISLMLLITPPILATYDRKTVCEGDKLISEIKKHEDIYLAIESQDLELATDMMKQHFNKLSKHITSSDSKK